MDSVMCGDTIFDHIDIQKAGEATKSLATTLIEKEGHYGLDNEQGAWTAGIILYVFILLRAFWSTKHAFNPPSVVLLEPRP